MDCIDLRLGFYGDYVFNRRLRGNTGEQTLTIQRVQLSTNAGLIVLHLWDRLDLFGTIGATKIVVTVKVGGFERNLSYFTDPSYSGGGRLTLLDWQGLYAGIEGQYFYTHVKPEQLFSPGPTTSFTSFGSRNEDYNEWQVSLAAAYRFQDFAHFAFIPYAGIQLARVQWNRAQNLVGTTRVPDLIQQQTTGWALGVTGLMNDLIAVTVEGRWANEKALSVIGQLSF